MMVIILCIIAFIAYLSIGTVFWNGIDKEPFKKDGIWSYRAWAFGTYFLWPLLLVGSLLFNYFHSIYSTWKGED